MTHPTDRHPTRLVIVGAGGFGHEVLDLVERATAAGADLAFVGFLDDGEPDRAGLQRRNAAHLGPTHAIPPGYAFLIGIGDPVVRARLDDQLRGIGGEAPALIDPAASLGSNVSLGTGTFLLAGARVSTNARLGRHCHVNLNAVVGHDGILGDCVSVSPGANLGGAVRVGDRVTIGTGANVLPGVTIGDDVVIGAGAVVVGDVAAGSVVVGNPARPIRSRP